MKYLFTIFALLLFVQKSWTQSSVIQDGDGETSLQLFKSNSVNINAEKESIGFSISPKDYTNKDTKFWTITSSAATKKGTSNIFKGGEAQFSGKLGGNLITDKTDYTLDEINIFYQFIGVEFIYSRHNTFDSTKVFKDQIEDQTNLGFRVNYGWNLENVLIDKPILKLLGEFTSGISISGGIKDNSDEIKQKEIITNSSIIIDSAQTRSISETENAFLLNEIKTGRGFGRLNFDFGKHLLKRRLLANFHLTYALDQGLKPSLNPAIGLFVTEKGAPLNAVVGLQIQTTDWSNLRDSNKSRWERTSLVLTAGFPFN